MTDVNGIVIYGTAWCGGSRRCRLLLDRWGIPYQWVDIDQDEKAGKLVESLNQGRRSVPTIVWSDGSKLTEPTDEELAKKMGIRL
jgi:mycoredoxin